MRDRYDMIFDLDGPSPTLGEVVSMLLRCRPMSARRIAVATGAHVENVAEVMRGLGLPVPHSDEEMPYVPEPTRGDKR